MKVARIGQKLAGAGALLTVMSVLAAAGPAVDRASAAAPSKGGTTTTVSVSISTPTAGATVPSSFTSAGKSSSKNGIAKVTVSVDGGAATTASGTTSWTADLGAASGSHTVTATAYDTRGNS